MINVLGKPYNYLNAMLRISPLCVLSILFFLCNSSTAFSKPPGKKEWGFYQIYWAPGQFAQGVDRQLKNLGGTPKFVLFFRDLNPGRGFPKEAAKFLHTRNLIPIISLELWNWSEGRKGGSLESIVEGAYDDFFETWAKKAGEFGQLVILRFGFEMNGDWFSWGQKPKLFRDAWRRVHAIFQKNNTRNIKWMFAPNILFGTNRKAVSFHQYYPGDDVVDLIGVDGYNFGDNHSQWHRWQTFSEIFEESVLELSKFNKPIFISEIGCANDPRKSAWIRDFLESVSQHAHIKAFIYFNYDKTRENEPNWSLDSDSKSLNVFRKWVANG